MTTIALCSVKHSPGATTAALAACAAWSDGPDASPILVEADPAGGDLAARLGVPFEPGLASLAASARHPGRPILMADHARPLPCGGRVLLAPSAPEHASGAVRTLGARMAAVLAESGGRGVVDCGRWSPESPASAVMATAELTLVVVHADLAGVDHLRSRLPALQDVVRDRLLLVLTGGSPYPPREVERATGVGVLGVIPRDPRAVAALYGGRQSRTLDRSSLLRAMRSMLECLAPSGERAPRRAPAVRMARA